MNKNFIKVFKNRPWYKEPFYIGTAILFFCFTSIITYTIYVDSNSEQLKYETSFNGRIDDIFSQKRTYYIHLSNKNQWIKLENFRNDSYPHFESKYFMGIVKKGDLLFKSKNSDSIHFERNEKTFSFKIIKED